MQFTGEASGIVVDWQTGKYTISFTCNEPDVLKRHYDSIKNAGMLDIKAVKHRQKRSLDANAYAWVLMSKIADVLAASKEEVYEEMLRRYGTLYEDEEGYITITVKKTVDISKIEGHWMKLKDNGQYAGYALIKGSSKYNTKEMSHFIDGVISDCQELGIETIPPAELKQMIGRWSP